MPAAAKWVLTYSGADITGDIAEDVISITYTDADHGKSDEIEARLEDRYHKWKGRWYPEKGDQLELWIGWRGRGLLPCGKFEVDEIEFEGAPDTVVVRGVSAPITESLRTRNTRAFEDQTLREIAEAIAGEHGLSVEGEIDEVTIERVTQNDERDLQFLRRLAEEYDHVFAVRGEVLFFQRIADLEAQDPAAVIPRGEMKRFSVRDRTHEIYKSCTVSYHHPGTNELIEVTVEDENIEFGDELKIKDRVDNREQAEKRAWAELRRHNAQRIKGRIEIVGDHRMVAGNVIALAGLRGLDGRYYVETSRHRVDRTSGYTTEVEVRRVP